MSSSPESSSSSCKLNQPSSLPPNPSELLCELEKTMLSSKDDGDIKTLVNCCICFENYTRIFRQPISMSCGHTFCKNCVRNMLFNHVFQCPLCRTVCMLTAEKMNKNLALSLVLEKLNLFESDENLKEAALPNLVPDQLLTVLTDDELLNYTRDLSLRLRPPLSSFDGGSASEEEHLSDPGSPDNDSRRTLRSSTDSTILRQIFHAPESSEPDPRLMTAPRMFNRRSNTREPDRSELFSPFDQQRFAVSTSPPWSASMERQSEANPPWDVYRRSPTNSERSLFARNPTPPRNYRRELSGQLQFVRSYTTGIPSTPPSSQ